MFSDHNETSPSIAAVLAPSLSWLENSGNLI